MAQAPGQQGAFVPDSSEPREVDTKLLRTAAPLPVWGTRQGIGLSHHGGLGLAPPGWFGLGLMTSPSFATAISDRWRVTWGRKQGQAVLAMLLKQAQAVSAVLMGVQPVDFDLHPPKARTDSVGGQSRNRQCWRCSPAPGGYALPMSICGIGRGSPSIRWKRPGGRLRLTWRTKPARLV